ncbi:molecular chaperone [Serratia marcescens]|nr:molecular chaperone [Serratia marcescens]MBH3063774.1 molecular chaperone [Serratia marcescens]
MNKTGRLLLMTMAIASSAGVSLSTYAGGVGIDATRIIYPQQSKSVATSVRNNDSSAYLTQVSVSKTLSGGQAPFVVTPPLFRMEPRTHNQIKITKLSGTELPSDRESLYWFTMQAIPSVKDISGSPTKVNGAAQIALGTSIKLIYRPANLPVPPEKGFGMLSFSRAVDGIKIRNASPYYVSFLSFKVGGKELITNTQTVKMVAPLSDVVMPARNLAFPSKVNWIAINDIGGEVKFDGEVQ